jgi:hypothetical protein
MSPMRQRVSSRVSQRTEVTHYCGMTPWILKQDLYQAFRYIKALKIVAI